MEDSKKKKSARIPAALCFIMALALLLSAAGNTLAKYIRSDGGSSTAVAAPFYFTSDKLSEASPYYQVADTIKSDSAEISFTLYNYIDELRCTDETISYEYWVVRGEDADGEVIATSNGSGTISGEQQSKEIVIAMKKDAFGADGIVTVVVKATKPYEKIITARFGFAAQNYDLQWRVADEGSAVVVSMASGYAQNITVAWQMGLSPDMTDSVFAGTSGNSVTFSIQPGVTYALTFFKANSSEIYTKENFDVSIS